jgi:predicted signal transduction protein with EAL and GGDEF domain
MNSAPQTLVNAEGEAHKRSGIGRSVFMATFVIVGVNLFTAAATLLLKLLPDHALWILRLTLSAAAVTLVYMVARRHRRQWNATTQMVANLLQQVRMGSAPIEELSNVQGSLAPLAKEVQEMLRDMRLQRQELQELRIETEQKIAQHTSAMEHTVNSLRRQATRDPLTGLFNRRMLDQMLPQFIEQCRGANRPMSLLMIDMDHFKDLNDALGHVKGDEMLRSLGQIIQSTISVWRGRICRAAGGDGRVGGARRGGSAYIADAGAAEDVEIKVAAGAVGRHLLAFGAGRSDAGEAAGAGG